AGALARAGRKTALVEREHVGGTCVNEGCTPTKTMVASARVAYLARRGADYGVRTGPVSVDLARVRQRKRDIVASFRGGGEKGLEFGQMFRRFGSRVTVVQRDRQLLGREDADVAAALTQILREDGVDVLLRTEALRVRQSAESGIELAVRTAEGERAVTG